MARQDFYCSYCDSEFIIDSPTLSPINYCANCGAEVDSETSVDDEDDYDNEWED